MYNILMNKMLTNQNKMLKKSLPGVVGHKPVEMVNNVWDFF